MLHRIAWIVLLFAVFLGCSSSSGFEVAADPDAGELEAARDAGCSPLAPSCCPSKAPGDLTACEAAAGASAPKGWTWTRTANVAFRCSPAVVAPAPQPCAHSYALGAGALFCCVVGS